jgi:hypothetical protein
MTLDRARSERGYVGFRLLVVLGVMVALVWVVPLVFLDEGGTTGAAGPTAPRQPAAEPQAAAPTGSSGAPDVASHPIGAAEDVAAQSTLNEAIRGAQAYFAEQGSFEGYGPDAAKAFDPSIVYTAGAAAPGMVSMAVTPTSVVLVTLVERGGYLCVAADGNLVTFGRSNAATADQCSGGWQ